MSELRAAERLDAAGSLEVALELGLTAGEHATIMEELGRPPGRSELTIFAGMWSEHCSYKSTRDLLATLPKQGEGVLAGPGSHAGCVDVGDGWAVAFKIESHNHPSAVEPYQGAATGVGGILRDIVAQGARPCAVMDSLCFGDSGDARARFLEDGVVAGIAGYGNAYGVPNVGGKTVHDPRYEGNPLVNALAAGLLRHDGLRTADAKGVGNKVLYAGASTGRDGILGAAFASEELAEETHESRSHVQVGDPFMGKKLMEACLAFGEELGMVAGQDMGACGITCASIEMAAAGKVGMELDLSKVPLREADMFPHEILLSESQERFLFVVDAARADEAVAHFRRHGVHAALVGEVTAGDRVRIRHGGELVVDLPAALVADEAPLANWPRAETLPEPTPYEDFEVEDLEAALLDVLAAPGVADLEDLWSHYDQTVGNRTVRGPGEADAAVLKLPDSRRGFALAITGDGPRCALSPREGSRAALGEATRRLACAGARITAITDGLNMGSPSDPVEARRLAETIEGLRLGLEELGIPVTGGNASLYNESPKGAIPPTPMVGALGRIDDVGTVPRSRLGEGEVLFLVGPLRDDPVHSTHGRVRTGSLEGHGPAVDLAADQALAGLVLAACAEGLVRGARASHGGGLGAALVKMCVKGGVGVDAELPQGFGRPDWMLLGEYPGQAWLSVAEADADRLEELATERGVDCRRVGKTGGDTLVLRGMCELGLADARAALAARTKGRASC